MFGGYKRATSGTNDRINTAPDTHSPKLLPQQHALAIDQQEYVFVISLTESRCQKLVERRSDDSLGTSAPVNRIVAS